MTTPERRGRCRRLPDIAADVQDALAAAAIAQDVPLRVVCLSPHVILIADDCAAPRSDGSMQGLQRVLAVALGIPHLELRRLSDEPEARRDTVWRCAWAPAAMRPTDDSPGGSA